MANFNDAFQPEAGINFDDLLGIFAGTTDPAAVGEIAPLGSLFIRSNGSLFQKTGAGNTEWTQFTSGSDVTVKISASDTTPDYLSPKLLVGPNLTKTINNPGANETLTLDLSNVGTPGTYTSVTVDSKGRVTAGTNPGFLTSNQTITLSGDVTGSGSTAITTTLNNTTVVAGSYQSADITINSQGRITAAASSPYVSIPVDTAEPTGFVNRADSTISFVDGTRVFAIAPAVTSFEVYLKGTKFTKTAAETVTVPNTTGLYYIYYVGSSCTLTVSASPWSLADVAPVAMVYWNAAQGKNVLFAEERHGIVMDWATHDYLHHTRGTQFAGGFALNPMPNTGGIGDTDDETQVDLDPGTMYDEDIEISVIDDTTPDAQFEQSLTGPALIPMFYKLGAEPGIWYRDTATAFPVKMGTTYPYWNQFTAGSWQLTETAGGGGSKFIATWLIATNDVNEPIIGVVGQAEYSSLSQAQGEETWQGIIGAGGLPFAELRPLWRIIYEVKNNFTNTIKSTIRDVQDLRAVTVVTVAGAAQTDHGALTGLEDDDHPQYVHVSTQRVITAQHQFAPSTAQPAFTLSANAQAQLITGLNADLLDGLHATAFQPIDGDLTALAALTTTGLAVRTGTDTWATRSLIGVTGRIVVTNPDGVTTNPTIDLATAGTAGTYGSATLVPVFTTDVYGRVTAVTNTAITFPVLSVFGRTGAVVAAEGDYTLTQLGDVTLTSPTNGQVLQFNGTTWVNATAAGGGSGTVTSVSATQPVAGLTITGSPITTSGTLTFALANDLGAIEALDGTGFYTRTGTDTWAARSLTQPAAGLTITNPAGTAGNPTFALANDLAAVEGLATTGIAVRTAADTWATRTIQGTTSQITVTNGGGIAGDPAVAIATNPIIPGTGSIQVPSGTTAERTSPASNGMVRYNTTTNQYEAWVVDKWVGLALFSDGGTFQLNAYLGAIPSTSGTSLVPYDSTEPLVTEGTEIWTRTVTPSNATSRFVVECPFTVDLGTSNRVLIVSLFRGSINLGTALFYSTGGGRPVTLSMKVNDEPGTTAPITYSMRAGVGAGTATWYINATAGGQTLGGKLVSQYEIREFNQ